MRRIFACLSVALLTFLLGVAVVALKLGPREFYPEPISPPIELSSSSNVTVNVTAWRPLPPVKLPVFTKLESIAIERYDADSEITETTLSPESEISIELDLGESIENQIIALKPFRDDRRKFKVEQQFETSMALGDEGPHFDLTDWKHYTSEWKEIADHGENTFLTRRIAESESSKFPKVTAEQVRRAVKAAGGDKRWTALAESCTEPGEGACYTGVSRISFRISANENGKWKQIHKIDFLVPMGC